MVAASDTARPAVDLFGSDIRPARAFGGVESHSGGTDEWLTPPSLIAALGQFDLDPCSPINRPWPTARKHFTIEDDGLRQQWEGRVWMNPPYAHAGKWLHKLAEHGTGTAFVFARTETRAWHDHVWPHATGLFFLRGRVAFHYSDGRQAKSPAAAPSVFISYGIADAEALRRSGLDGRFVDLRGRA